MHEERLLLDEKAKIWEEEKERSREQQEAWAMEKARLMQRNKEQEETISTLTEEVSSLEESMKVQNEQHLQQLLSIRDEARNRTEDQRSQKESRNKEREEEAKRYAMLQEQLVEVERVRDQLRNEVREQQLSAKVQEGELAKAKAVWEEKERNKNDEIMNLRADLRKERARSMEISIAAASAAASVTSRADKEQIHPNVRDRGGDGGITPPSIAKALLSSKTPFLKK